MLLSILSSLAINIPLYIVWIITIIIAVINKKDYPKVSLLTITAVSIILIMTAGSSLTSAILPHMYMKYGFSNSYMGSVLFIINIFRTFISALAWALMVVAIFGWRNRNEYFMAEDRKKE